jgi:hypothetical protein
MKCRHKYFFLHPASASSDFLCHRHLRQAYIYKLLGSPHFDISVKAGVHKPTYHIPFGDQLCKVTPNICGSSVRKFFICGCSGALKFIVASKFCGKFVRSWVKPNMQRKLKIWSFHYGEYEHRYLWNVMPYRLVVRHRGWEWVLLATPSGQYAADGCTIPLCNVVPYPTECSSRAQGRWSHLTVATRSE